MEIDRSNIEQLSAWNGHQGDFWVARADRFDDGVAAYREHLFAAAAIEDSHDVLDIGCGAGSTTCDAARAAIRGTAVGVDLSSRLLDLARRRAEADDVENAVFLQADAQVHSFAAGSFDTAISRHGCMFFGDPVAAFSNIGRAMRPGGRLALLTWQPLADNEWQTTFRRCLSLAPPPPNIGPFSMSDPDVIHRTLSAAGWVGIRCEKVSEPMFFGRTVDEALDFVLDQFGSAAAALDDEARCHADDALRRSMSDHLTEHGVRYGSAAWLVTAHASVST
ncbi:class I SAM-dependent methyltransferase [Actinomycetes bacterium M1A6_2h]